MTTVLVLVYLAGVAESLQIALGLLGGGGLLVIAFVSLVTEGEAWPFLKKYIPLAIASGLVAIFVPSKELLYMAAGLKAGSEVAQTEIGRKAYTLLDRKLDELLGTGDK